MCLAASPWRERITTPCVHLGFACTFFAAMKVLRWLHDYSGIWISLYGFALYQLGYRRGTADTRKAALVVLNEFMDNFRAFVLAHRSQPPKGN